MNKQRRSLSQCTSKSIRNCL